MNFNASSMMLHSLWHDKPVWFLILAFLLYGLWGSPTPNNPDWVEALIALSLIGAVGFSSILKSFLLGSLHKNYPWFLWLKIFFLCGLIIPLIIGVISGQDKIIILRDVVAFIFLCMPLFLYECVSKTSVRQKLFFILCLVVGLFFSVRVLVPHFLLFRNTTELLYLANSPLVLMSALFFIGQAGYLIYKRTSLRYIILAFGCLILASLPIMAMAVDLQRASFVALILTFISLPLIAFIKAPFKIIVPVIFLFMLIVVFYEYGLNVIENVGAKTAQVGLNMRLQELQAIWEHAAYHPFYILFGQGWGAQFASPAVGNLNVSYTHSLLSYLFLKMGLVGLFLSLIYLYFIFEKLLRLYFSDMVKGNALIWPFVIPIFLYASHKSFDFGVLLTLVLVMSYSKNEAKKHVS